MVPAHPRDRSRSDRRPAYPLLALTFMLLLLIAATGHAGALTPAAQASRGQPIPADAIPTDQIIVQFSDPSAADSLASPTSPRGMESIDQLSAAAGVELTLERTLSEDTVVLKLPERMSISEVERISRALVLQPGVQHAEPDTILTIAAARPQTQAPARVLAPPNDPQFANQWHYVYAAGSKEGINLLPAWDITQGSADVVVAVVDTGILGSHGDLAGRVLPGYDFINDTFVSNDGDGRDNDPSDPGDWVTAEDGCGFTSNSSWHGSHVAGTVGAKTGNNVGGSGVTWGSKILPVRTLGKCGGYTSDVLDGVRWAAGLSVTGVPNNPNKADVINMSLGGQRLCGVVEQQVYTAVRNAGVVVVAAAGNSVMNAANFAPANCNNVIAVAATNKVGNYSWYSNYGDVVDVSAPGGETSPTASEGVLSTVSNGTTVPTTDGFKYYQGTSMAAPHVSGVAALMLSVAPSLTPAEVEQVLKDTARPFPAGSLCTVADCGEGIVDAFQALDSLVEDPPPAPTLVSPADGANVADATPTLDWSDASGATGYELQMSTNAGFSELVVETDVAASTFTPANSLPNDQYYWRVRSTAGSLKSGWSDAWSFTVQFCATPARPVLSFPLNGATLGDVTPTLTWAAAADASSYEVVVDDDSDLSSPVFTQTLAGTSVIVDPPLDLGEYTWAVRGRNSAGGCNVAGEWSSAWSFTLADVESFVIAVPIVVR